MTDRAGPGHRLGRLSVEASIEDADTALRLRPMLEAQAFGPFAGRVERVLDDLDPGSLVKIGRLDLDLGTLNTDHLEADLGPAFEAALRDALNERLKAGEDQAVEPWENPSRIYVANAGMVLLQPFLPHLFERLGLLTASGARPVLEGEAAARAVWLLQYLIDGDVGAAEEALALNKLLCGLSPEVEVGPRPVLDAADLAVGDSLLRAVLGSWPTLSNTSVAGLRETFLQREGRLDRREEGWSLTVQRKTLDVLVDQVPWSFSTIFQRWMPAPIHVTW